MVFKKLVSGIASLAIAGSMFAGLAVTAGAADITAADVVFGTYVAATETDAASVTPQTDFSTEGVTGYSENAEGTTYTYLDTTYMDGSVLKGNQAGGRTYNFTTAVSTGQVKLSMSFTIPANSGKTTWALTGTKTDGTSYDVAYSTSGTGDKNWSDSTLLSIPNSDGETTVVSGHNYQPRTRNCVYLKDLTVSMADKTLTYTFVTYPSGSSGSLTGSATETTGTVSLPDDLASITGLSMPRCGSNYDCYFDSISFYHIPADPTAPTSVPEYSVPSNSTNVQKLVTSLTEASTATYSFTQMLNENSGAKSVTNIDFYFGASTSEIGIFPKATKSGKDVTNTSFTLAPGKISYDTGSQSSDTVAGMTEGKWYRLTFEITNKADTMGVTITDLSDDSSVYSKSVKVRNSGDMTYRKIDVTVGDDVGATYLANVVVYNPTITYTYKVDGEVYDTVTAVEGVAPTAPATNPTKDGYTFVEWEADENDSTVYNAVFKKTHAEAFKFDTLKVSDLGNGMTLTVTFKDTDGNVSDKTLTETLNSDTTFSGVAAASIAVIVTDIADGYSVNSITIE